MESRPIWEKPEADFEFRSVFGAVEAREDQGIPIPAAELLRESGRLEVDVCTVTGDRDAMELS